MNLPVRSATATTSYVGSMTGMTLALKGNIS